MADHQRLGLLLGGRRGRGGASVDGSSAAARAASASRRVVRMKSTLPVLVSLSLPGRDGHNRFTA